MGTAAAARLSPGPLTLVGDVVLKHDSTGQYTGLGGAATVSLIE
jgi:hypothetical protein